MAGHKYVRLSLEYVRLFGYTEYMNPVTPSKLRDDLYNALDKVLETGQPLVIRRKGRILKIVPEEKPDIFTRLRKHPTVLKTNPDDIVHMDWSSEWNDTLSSAS